MFRWIISIALVAASQAVLLPVGPVHAIGYWNMPGNVAQWWGYGWGGGYHACLVLGPVSHEGAFAHNQTRLRYAPQAPCGSYGSCGCQYDFRQPVPYESQQYQAAPTIAAPSAEPMPEPAPEAMLPDPLPMPGNVQAPSAIFPAPVEP